MPAAVWQSTTRLRTGDDNGDEVNTAGNNEKKTFETKWHRTQDLQISAAN